MSIPPARGAREREAEAREAAAAKLPPPECSLFFRYHTELPPKEGGALSRSPSCQALKGSDLGRSELVVAVKSTQVPSRASLHRSHTLTRSRTSPTLRTDLPFRGAMSHELTIRDASLHQRFVAPFFLPAGNHLHGVEMGSAQRGAARAQVCPHAATSTQTGGARGSRVQPLVLRMGRAPAVEGKD